MEGVDFYVHGYQQIQIGGATVYITTTHVCLAIVMCALIIFAIVANRKIKKADPSKAPTGFVNIIELIGTVWTQTADSRLWCDPAACSYHICDDPIPGLQVAEDGQDKGIVRANIFVPAGEYHQ